jgi:hypothetical protein
VVIICISFLGACTSGKLAFVGSVIHTVCTLDVCLLLYFVYVYCCREGFELQVDNSHEVETLASAGIRKNFDGSQL